MNKAVEKNKLSIRPVTKKGSLYAVPYTKGSKSTRTAITTIGVKTIYTHKRRLVLNATHLGLRFYVHNGLYYVPVVVQSWRFGKHLGNFSKTKKRPVHKRKVAKKIVSKK